MGDEYLVTLESKLQTVRDRVVAVARKTQTGLYLYGPGGTGKSHEIRKTLDRVGASWMLTNSRITARSLFELLRDNPNITHVLEDIEPLFFDKTAAGILRAALWGYVNSRGRYERPIDWNVAKCRERCYFEGGLVILVNKPLHQVPELAAVASRIDCIEFRPTNQELAAKMRSVAQAGFLHAQTSCWLPPEACAECVEEIIERSRNLGQSLDMRLMEKTWADRISCINGDFQRSWKDHLENRLKGRVLMPAEPVISKADPDAELLKELAVLPANARVPEWQRRTGKSRATFFREWKRFNESQSHGETA